MTRWLMTILCRNCMLACCGVDIAKISGAISEYLQNTTSNPTSTFTPPANPSPRPPHLHPHQISTTYSRPLDPLKKFCRFFHLKTNLKSSISKKQKSSADSKGFRVRPTRPGVERVYHGAHVLDTLSPIRDRSLQVPTSLSKEL